MHTPLLKITGNSDHGESLPGLVDTLLAALDAAVETGTQAPVRCFQGTPTEFGPPKPYICTLNCPELCSSTSADGPYGAVDSNKPVHEAWMPHAPVSGRQERSCWPSP